LLADGRVLITNGPNAPSQIYDPTTGQFTPTGTMGTWRANYTATLLSDGTVLIAGGYTNPSTPGTGVVPVTSTEIYNPSTGAFDPGPTMRQGRYQPTATRLPDGSVLFVGGVGGTTLASAEIYH
jgi:Galactose oxidase, central domain